MKSRTKNVASQSFKILLCLVMLLMFLVVTPKQKIHAISVTMPLGAEMAKDAFLGIYAGLVTVGGYAVAQSEYVGEKSQELINIAGETWDSMSLDMRENFAQSVSSAGDGVILAGDFITNVLDLIKPKYQQTSISNEHYNAVVGSNSVTFNFKGDSVFVYNASEYYTVKFSHSVSSDGYTSVVVSDSYGKMIVPNASVKDYPQISSFITALTNGTATLDTLLLYLKTLGYTKGSVIDGGVLQGQPDVIYNQLDKWLRDNLLPKIDAGEVIYPNTQGWTANGDRVFVNTDGSALVLEDGTPYSGEYAWRKPITGLVDGVPAVLDPSTLNWKDIAVGSTLAVATAGQVAEYLQTTPQKAEEVIKKTNNKKPSVDVKTDEDGSNISIVINNDIDNDDGDGLSSGYRCVEKGQVVSCKDIEQIDGGLLEYVKNSYDYAVNAVKSGVDGLNAIVSGSVGLIALYSNIFDWLPPETKVILTSGLLLMIGLRVFRK